MRGTAVGLTKSSGDVAVAESGVVLVVTGEIVCSVIHLNFKRFSIEYIILPSASILISSSYITVFVSTHHTTNITFSIPHRSRLESIHRI